MSKKNLLIVGGSGLIGSAICEKFIKEKYNVYSLDIKDKIKKKNSNYKYFYFDVKSTEDLELNFLKIIKKIKKIDCFINCSYPINKEWNKSNFDKIKFNNFIENTQYNLINQSWLYLLAAKKMRENKQNSSIITIGSIYGFLAQNENIYKGTSIKKNIIYSIAKGGIINLTRQMAAHYGKYNITVNCISPGALKGHIAGSKYSQPKKFINEYTKTCPIKRLGHPTEVADLAYFLCSESSRYINGQNIVIDGGWSVI